MEKIHYIELYQLSAVSLFQCGIRVSNIIIEFVDKTTLKEQNTNLSSLFVVYSIENNHDLSIIALSAI